MKKLSSTTSIFVALLACSVFFICCTKEEDQPEATYEQPERPPYIVGTYKSINTEINGINSTNKFNVVLKIQIDSVLDKLNRPLKYMVTGTFQTTEMSPFGFNKIDSIQNAIIRYSEGSLIGGQSYKAISFLQNVCRTELGSTSSGDSGTTYFLEKVCVLTPKLEFLYNINNDGTLTFTRYVDNIKHIYMLKK